MAKTWFTVKKLSSSIWGIAEFGQFEAVISYLFVGKNEALLFDTGMGIGDIKQEVNKLTNLPVRVVNSHCHYDHIGGNFQFSSIGIFDSSWGQNKAKVGYASGEVSQFVTENSFFQSPPVEYDFNNHVIPPFVPTALLHDSEEINMSPFLFQIIHTPGHTPDSISLLEKSTGILLTGDSVYEGPIYLYFPESSFIEYAQSIRKLLAFTGVKKIFPSHNGFFLHPLVLREIGKAIENTDSLAEDSIFVSSRIILKLREE